MLLENMFMVEFLLLIALALLISSIGFYKYVYFISLGYGFSIAAIGLAMLIMFYQNNIGLLSLLPCLLFVIYGNRLGGYLLIREIKSASYRNTMKTEIKDGKSMNMIAKLSIWISCALLYVCQISPVLYRLQLKEKVDIISGVGMVIMILGILLESLSDWQKSMAKKKNPKRFCDSGVFKIVRCPNYFGEVLFWTGVFLSGVTALHNVWQWSTAIIGYVCIVYIMFGGARRLEIRQNKNYGNDKEYQSYVKKTPILIPLIPLYSVAKHKWLLG